MYANNFKYLIFKIFSPINDNDDINITMNAAAAVTTTTTTTTTTTNNNNNNTIAND